MIGVVLVIALLGVTGCTGDGEGPDAEPSGPTTIAGASTTISDQMPHYLREADRANARTEHTVVSTAARPTVTLQDSELMTMVIRDEGQDRWEAGNYRLVVYCVGAGTIYAHFSLGERSEVTELPTCTPTVTTGIVELTLPDPATNSSVLIIPAGNAQAAIAYQIQKFQG
ncbi:hypothetical protein [Plantactinospora sp. B5E13]|uniref:hypothetical protein n=1 Tax=Plantactinospora sp. B5E13 TaxID=3153758 RepID=UPI00325ECBFD